MKAARPSGPGVELRKTARQFAQTAPVMLGVLLLAGLLSVLELPPAVLGLLAESNFLGPLIGAAIGGIATGNPMTSYVLGGELLSSGVALVSVAALVVSWVSVGVVQIPLEMKHLGRRFALVRNVLAFVFAVVVAHFSVVTFSMVAP